MRTVSIPTSITKVPIETDESSDFKLITDQEVKTRSSMQDE